MMIFTNRIRRAYLKRRTIGEMALFTLMVIAVVMLFSVAGHEARQPEGDEATLPQETKNAIVARWYADIYPAYAVVPPERRP